MAYLSYHPPPPPSPPPDVPVVCMLKHEYHHCIHKGKHEIRGKKGSLMQQPTTANYPNLLFTDRISPPLR